MHRVAVTGWGMVTPWGTDPSAFEDAVFNGRSSIAPLNFDGDTTWPQRAASRILNFSPKSFFSASELATLDRTSQFAQVAGLAALQMAGGPSTWDLARADVLVGTGMGSAATIEATYQQLFQQNSQRLKPLSVPTGMNNSAAAHLAIRTGFEGSNITYCCACSSSAISIGEGMKRIRHGEADVVLAGGAEALITPGVMWAWEALRTLADIDLEDPSRSCKPFSSRRTGLVMGEGAVFFVLESFDSARSRGCEILGELVGYASTSDSVHLTRPTPEGQARAMRQALRDAQISPEDIGYINAHGTATAANDAAEAAAIATVFPAKTPVSSTKAVHGHWMGAASAVELLTTLMALRREEVPPTAFLEDVDPLCALNHVRGAPQKTPGLSYAMSNSFAFGGTSGVLIAKKPE